MKEPWTAGHNPVSRHRLRGGEWVGINRMELIPVLNCIVTETSLCAFIDLAVLMSSLPFLSVFLPVFWSFFQSCCQAVRLFGQILVWREGSTGTECYIKTWERGKKGSPWSNLRRGRNRVKMQGCCNGVSLSAYSFRGSEFSVSSCLFRPCWVRVLCLFDGLFWQLRESAEGQPHL